MAEKYSNNTLAILVLLIIAILMVLGMTSSPQVQEKIGGTQQSSASGTVKLTIEKPAEATVKLTIEPTSANK